MKTLTLTQPYASLIAFGAKRIETRTWATTYRGPLAIHAAAGLGPIGGVSGLKRIVQQEPFRPVFAARDREHGTDILHDPSHYLPRGAVVALCTLVTCVRTTQCTAITDQERAFGEYSPGRYAWILSDVQPLNYPVPAKGQLGLWEWALHAELVALSERLRRVRIVSGDFARVLTPAVTTGHGLTAVILDPPYDLSEREHVYSHEDASVAYVGACIRAGRLTGWTWQRGPRGRLYVQQDAAGQFPLPDLRKRH